MQHEFWNSASGDKWVDHQDFMNATHAPVCAALMERAGVGVGDRVLDVGCGTGQSTRPAARAAGRQGHVTGLDIATNLLNAARSHEPEPEAAPIDYVEADAARKNFEGPGFDRLISQMGVMFFEDPVAAFSNLRTAANPGGHFTFAAWAALDENPWFHIPRNAAFAEFGEQPFDPDAPGPTALWNRDRVTGLFRDAGWERVDVEVARFDLTPPGDLDTVVAQVNNVGPAARIFKEQNADAAARARVSDAVRDAFGNFDTPDGVRVPAVFNIYTGRAPR